MPLYQIETQLNPETLTITGNQTIILTNTEEVSLDKIYVHLYANAAHFNEGSIAIDDVQVDGQVVDSQLERDEIDLNIPHRDVVLSCCKN
ncbi:MAG: M1 family peptidase [Chloroflexi bacterium AL-W]|nr:M1 family peptidase [Chloroflexi bacterium AL-N1]NOK68581.1 M1 family peptidase [Chloroflexi bacterium AL-N10]NOK76067.1 M1 family peptidase [Chloroflexi bacterium AL-N5]NOK82540.1 M1 family peptidase [Chloroflexi bacterium AL-W]NOK92850.1 M1 family peptidase [Chloroflexi bacterium AL-N15]